MAGFYVPDFQTIGKSTQPGYTAAAARDACDDQILALADNQTFVVSGCTVAPKTPASMTVHVAAGKVLISGVLVAVAAQTLTLTTSAPTHDRRDLIAITPAGVAVQVKGTACTAATWTAATKTNNPPVKPAVPATRCPIYEAGVRHSTTTLTAARLVDKRSFGPIPAPTPSSTIFQLTSV